MVRILPPQGGISEADREELRKDLDTRFFFARSFKPNTLKGDELKLLILDANKNFRRSLPKESPFVKKSEVIIDLCIFLEEMAGAYSFLGNKERISREETEEWVRLVNLTEEKILVSGDFDKTANFSNFRRVYGRLREGNLGLLKQDPPNIFASLSYILFLRMSELGLIYPWPQGDTMRKWRSEYMTYLTEYPASIPSFHLDWVTVESETGKK